MKTLALFAALVASTALAVGPNATSANLTVQNAAGNSGSCTASSCAVSVLQVTSGTIFTPTWSIQNTVSVNLAGTWSGTVTFQASFDEGATWNAFPCFPAQTVATQQTATPVTTATANGNWQCDVGGATTFRTVATSFASGPIAVIQESYAAVGSESIATIPPSQNSQKTSYSAIVSPGMYSSAGGIAAVEADGTNKLYLRHIKVCEPVGTIQTQAGPRQLILIPTTAASSGGATQTPVPRAYTDPAFGGIVRGGNLTLSTDAGTIGVTKAIDQFVLQVPITGGQPLVASPCVDTYYGDQFGQMKAPSVGPTTAQGLALYDLTGGAGADGGFNILMEFTTEIQ